MTKSGEILEEKRWIQSITNPILIQKSLCPLESGEWQFYLLYFALFISDGVRSLHYPA